MFYCGIDVAKRSHQVTVIDEDKKVVLPSQKIDNDRAGFDQLIGDLLPYQGRLQIGLEATGHYWLPLYETLTQQGFAVSVINPLQVHAYSKLDMRRRKTDKKDAYCIADFVRFANPEPTRDNLPSLLQMRELSRFRFRLVQQISDNKRRIIAVLDRVFPEYERLFSDVFLKSSRRLLQEAVTPDELAEFDLSELSALLSSASRGHFGMAKAEEIRAAASRSVGVSFLADAVQIEIRCLLEQIALLETQCKEVEERLAQLMEEMSQHIMTIPGIKLVTGAAILSEIGDIKRFASIEKLVAFAGIDPSVYQTGEFEGTKSHMSKRGSPYLRYYLWLAANSSRQSDTEMRAYYEKKRAEGKPHNVVMGALCRKLLARIFIILKEDRPYIKR